MDRSESLSDLYSQAISRLSVATLVLDESGSVLQSNPVAEEILAREEAARRVNVPYAIEATIDAGGHVRPAHIKDRVRALGPTVRRDLAVPTADKTGWDWVI